MVPPTQLAPLGVKNYSHLVGLTNNMTESREMKYTSVTHFYSSTCIFPDHFYSLKQPENRAGTLLKS